MGELWDILFGVTIEKKFDLERILPVSVEDYVRSKGRGVNDFYMKCVHYFGTDKDGFQKAVPQNAEVVVGYRSSITLLPGFILTDVCFNRYEIALILKG